MTLDDRPNQPSSSSSSELATTSSMVSTTVEELPIIEVEGEIIRKMLAKMPGFEIELPVGYRRNTHLKFEIEVRVKGVNHREGKGKGHELERMHDFALEEIKLVGAYTADQLDPGVGGSAGVSAQSPDDRPAGTGTGEQRDVGF